MAMQHLTHWHILGAGSMGCLWAAYLNKAGHAVTLICKNEQQYTEFQQQRPLYLQINGQKQIFPNVTLTHPGLLTVTTPIKHVLVCVKAYRTEHAISAILPFIASNATIVLMQNGMGQHEWLCHTLPHCAIYAALTTEAALKHDQLWVEHTGHGQTQIGCINQHFNNHIMETLRCALECHLHFNIEAALWQKLVVNCCINPLTVLYECQNGELANNTDAQLIIQSIIKECKMLAGALGKPDYLLHIEDTVAEVIQRTAKNTSSMRQDALAHRQTEIDHINGYIIKQAKALGIATPANTAIVEAIYSYIAKQTEPTYEQHY
jgi:2-dehydropantoate 2-reductase